MKHMFAEGSPGANKTILEAVELVSEVQNTALMKGVAAIIGLLVFFISQRVMMLVADYRRRLKERLRRQKHDAEDVASALAPNANSASKGGAKAEESVAFVPLSPPPPPTADVAATNSNAKADSSTPAASSAPPEIVFVPGATQTANDSSPSHKISAIACVEEAGSGSIRYIFISRNHRLIVPFPPLLSCNSKRPKCNCITVLEFHLHFICIRYCQLSNMRLLIAHCFRTGILY